MDRGAIVAQGTHEALLRTSDLYRELCTQLLDEPETAEQEVNEVRT
jgi:ABC-type transport system involved in cytochrome bd biosynthesis fused ATPase/permease subunit